MRWFLLLLTAFGLTGATAAAQGVAPGGDFYNSTGIGSGLGGVIGGTGPTYPNGTAAPATPSPVPPGGLPPVGHIDLTPAPSPPLLPPFASIAQSNAWRTYEMVSGSHDPGCATPSPTPSIRYKGNLSREGNAISSPPAYA